jgi:hypothetical protein
MKRIAVALLALALWGGSIAPVLAAESLEKDKYNLKTAEGVAQFFETISEDSN